MGRGYPGPGERSEKIIRTVQPDYVQQPVSEKVLRTIPPDYLQQPLSEKVLRIVPPENEQPRSTDPSGQNILTADERNLARRLLEVDKKKCLASDALLHNIIERVRLTDG